ncbi:MAG TPA: FAD-dependent oxidoreductase [Kribbellaceae bacterium]|nr:FAD-dependent oxidoreductase [Kribbellaceae bacterium]
MHTSLLVIGAGPYGLSAAAHAREQGIDTVVTGRSMGFWRDHMPEGMYLRSGPEWHLDAAGVHTQQAYLEERGIDPRDVDPIPIGVFLDYAEWFRQAKGIEPLDDLVDDVVRSNGHFTATLSSGERIDAEAVVAAPGIAHFTHFPAWADSVPPDRATHTCDLVRFDDLAGARVLIVGGRQSAYEWAALLADHGAERIDMVHRHDVPAFERVSWSFVDAHVESTLRTAGWWRSLSRAEQDAIARRFWEVGRLTLEYWLTPRLPSGIVHRRPGAEVVQAAADTAVQVRLSSGEALEVDHVVFASGYRADLGRVPHLRGLSGTVAAEDGFPVLDNGFGTSVPGFYLTGFCATRDFGPFFGFVKAAPAAATLIVRDLLARR